MSANSRYSSTLRRDTPDESSGRVRSRSFKSSSDSKTATSPVASIHTQLPVRGRQLQNAVANLQSILARANIESELEEDEQLSRDSITNAEKRARTVLTANINDVFSQSISQQAMEERSKAQGLQRRKLQEVEFKARAHVRRQRDVELANLQALEKAQRPPPAPSPSVDVPPMLKEKTEEPPEPTPRDTTPPFGGYDDDAPLTTFDPVDDPNPSFVSDATAAPRSDNQSRHTRHQSSDDPPTWGTSNSVVSANTLTKAALLPSPPAEDSPPLASRRLSPQKSTLRDSDPPSLAETVMPQKAPKGSAPGAVEYPYPIPPRRRGELSADEPIATIPITSQHTTPRTSPVDPTIATLPIRRVPQHPTNTASDMPPAQRPSNQSSESEQYGSQPTSARNMPPAQRPSNQPSESEQYGSQPTSARNMPPLQRPDIDSRSSHRQPPSPTSSGPAPGDLGSSSMMRERSFTTQDSPTSFPEHVMRRLPPADVIAVEDSGKSGKPPLKGVLAVRFSSHVIKRRQVGFIKVQVDAKGMVVVKDSSLIGRISGAWGADSKGTPVASVDAISIGAATLGQKMRGVPTEVIPVKDVCVMVDKLEFNDPDAQELIMDEDGNAVMRGCPFYLVRKDDGAIVEMVCTNNAERLKWLAWLRSVTGEQVVIASEVSQALEEASTPKNKDTKRSFDQPSPANSNQNSASSRHVADNSLGATVVDATRTPPTHSTVAKGPPRHDTDSHVNRMVPAVSHLPPQAADQHTPRDTNGSHQSERFSSRDRSARSPPRHVPSSSNEDDTSRRLQAELQRAQQEISILRESRYEQDRKLLKQELLDEIRREEAERHRREREEEDRRQLRDLTAESESRREEQLNQSGILKRESGYMQQQQQQSHTDVLSPNSVRLLDAIENSEIMEEEDDRHYGGGGDVPMPFEGGSRMSSRYSSRQDLYQSSRHSSPSRYSSTSRRSSRYTSPVKDQYGNLYHTDDYGNRMPYSGGGSYANSRASTPHSRTVSVPRTIHYSPHHSSLNHSGSYSHHQHHLPPRTSAFEHYQSQLNAAATGRRRMFMSYTPCPSPIAPMRVVFDDLCLLYHPSLSAMNHSVYGRLVLVQGGSEVLMSPADPLGQLKHSRQLKANIDLMLPIASIKGFTIDTDHEMSLFLRTSNAEDHTDPHSDGVVWRVTGNDEYSNMLYCCQLLGERIGITVMNPRALQDLATALS